MQPGPCIIPQASLQAAGAAIWLFQGRNVRLDGVSAKPGETGHEHLVQFYGGDDARLGRNVARFLNESLRTAAVRSSSRARSAARASDAS